MLAALLHSSIQSDSHLLLLRLLKVPVLQEVLHHAIENVIHDLHLGIEPLPLRIVVIDLQLQNGV